LGRQDTIDGSWEDGWRGSVCGSGAFGPVSGWPEGTRGRDGPPSREAPNGEAMEAGGEAVCGGVRGSRARTPAKTL